MAENEANLTLKVTGARSIVDGLERSADALVPYRERLVAMGWTETMAREFLGGIAETIVRNLITVEPSRWPVEIMSDAMVAYGCGPDYLARLASPSQPDKFSVLHLIVHAGKGREVLRVLADMMALKVVK